MSVLEIAFKNVDYDIQLNLVVTAKDNLTPSAADVAEISCRADTMKKYRAKLSEVEGLLEQYKNLLGKDYLALKSVKGSLLQMDETLSRRFIR